MEWRKRKRGTIGQRGQAFPVGLHSKHISGNPKKDILKERYIQSIIRERRTHDISDSLMKLKRQAKHIIAEMKKANENRVQANRDFALAEAKLEVLKRTINTLSSIRQERTRVGDSELKMIMRKNMADLNVPSSTFK